MMKFTLKSEKNFLKTMAFALKSRTIPKNALSIKVWVDKMFSKMMMLTSKFTMKNVFQKWFPSKAENENCDWQWKTFSEMKDVC